VVELIARWPKFRVDSSHSDEMDYADRESPTAFFKGIDAGTIGHSALGEQAACQAVSAGSQPLAGAIIAVSATTAELAEAESARHSAIH